MAIKRNSTTKKYIDDSVHVMRMGRREEGGGKSQTIYSIKLFQGYGAFLCSLHVCHVQIIKDIFVVSFWPFILNYFISFFVIMTVVADAS